MSDRVTCPICGASFDPAVLDELRYHANDPHVPIEATGIIGQRIDAPDAGHTLEVEIVNDADGQPVRHRLWIDGEEVPPKPEV